MSPIDAEQAALPYELAAIKWGSWRDEERARHLKRYKRRINDGIQKIPKAVMKTITDRYRQIGKIQISCEPPVIHGGHMAPACAVFDESGQFLGLEISMPLLFAPEEVSTTIIAHEYAHAYLRASGRIFTGANVPWDCPFKNEYQDNLPMIEEEIAVDALTLAWGFGDRYDYVIWETAVLKTRSLECDNAFRAFRPVFRAQLNNRFVPGRR